MDKLVEKLRAAIGQFNLDEMSPGYEDDLTRAARACLAAIEAQGMVIVPREPTREMITAAYSQSDDLRLARFKWESMLNAAPKPPTPSATGK